MGQRWLFTLKLRVPWGAANPGGFDYRRWLLASGYSATGYVKTGRRLLTPDAVPFQLNLRDLLEGRGTLLALVTGNGSAVHAGANFVGGPCLSSPLMVTVPTLFFGVRV